MNSSKAPLAAQQALGKLISDETAASDLLVFLASLSPRPLVSKLGLPAGSYTFHREVVIEGRHRLDVLVRDSNGNPAAIIEMKGAADEHGDQLNTYAAWATLQNATQPPKLILATFEENDRVHDDTWQTTPLLELFDAWAGDDHPHARWLAIQIRDVMEAWANEAEAPLKDRTGHYVAKIAVRRTARDLHHDLRDRFGPEAECHPWGTKGPNPALFAYVPFPGEVSAELSSGKVWLLLDLRQADHRDSEKNWNLRLQVAVENYDEGDEDSALDCALATARQVLPLLSRENLAHFSGGKILLAGRPQGLKRSGNEPPELRDFYFERPKDASFRRVGVKYDVDVPQHRRTDVRDFCYAVLAGVYDSIQSAA